MFYKYEEINFINIKEFKNDKNSILILSNKSELKYLNNYSNYKFGAIVNNIDDLLFWSNKKINFIINPFNYKERFFDNSTFSLLTKNNINIIIIWDLIFEKEISKQIFIYKHLIILNKLCKKNKIPLIILNKDLEKTYQIYKILNYNKKQAKYFLSLVKL